jgi:hypothetical protein
MGMKPRHRYERKVVSSSQLRAGIWWATLDCGHGICLSRTPTETAWCEPCVSRAKDIQYHREELERLERWP